MLGQNVTFVCESSIAVQWRNISPAAFPSDGIGVDYIYSAGVIHQSDTSKSSSVVPAGRHVLILHNSSLTDVGEYICSGQQDGAVVERYVLSVKGNF